MSVLKVIIKSQSNESEHMEPPVPRHVARGSFKTRTHTGRAAISMSGLAGLGASCQLAGSLAATYCTVVSAVCDAGSADPARGVHEHESTSLPRCFVLPGTCTAYYSTEQGKRYTTLLSKHLRHFPNG
jgi:hypothetical protein